MTRTDKHVNAQCYIGIYLSNSGITNVYMVACDCERVEREREKERVWIARSVTVTVRSVFFPSAS